MLIRGCGYFFLSFFDKFAFYSISPVIYSPFVRYLSGALSAKKKKQPPQPLKWWVS